MRNTEIASSGSAQLPINEVESNADQEAKSLGRPQQIIAKVINRLFFGAGIGFIFFLTSLASLLRLTNGKSIGIISLSLAVSSVEGITNAALNSQVTKRIFRGDQYLLLIMLPFVFSLAGGPATLPLVAAVMQATEEIKDQTGVDITSLNSFLGNMTLLCYGIVSSMGFVNLVTKAYGYARWWYAGNQAHRFIQMKEYLDDQRSENEYKNFNPETDSFVQDKFSRGNLVALVFSLISFVYAFGIAGEISKALKSEESVWLIKTLGLFQWIPISDFGETYSGSLAISIFTQVPLCSSWVATTSRVLARDMVFLFNSLRNKDTLNITRIASYLVFASTTGLTAAFQALEGGNSNLMAVFTFISSCANNYGGPRELFFSKFISCCDKPGLLPERRTPSEREVDQHILALKRLENYSRQHMPQKEKVRCFGLDDLWGFFCRRSSVSVPTSQSNSEVKIHPMPGCVINSGIRKVA